MFKGVEVQLVRIYIGINIGRGIWGQHAAPQENRHLEGVSGILLIEES